MAKVVPIGDAAPPHLSGEARALWREVAADYEVNDAAGKALLLRACESLDRLRQVQAQIAKDGLMTKGYRGQPRPHPLLSVEAEANRAMLAAFRALNLDLSP